MSAGSGPPLRRAGQRPRRARAEGCGQHISVSRAGSLTRLLRRGSGSRGRLLICSLSRGWLSLSDGIQSCAALAEASPNNGEALGKGGGAPVS